MGDTLQIEVMGQKFQLKGTHDEEYIKRIENVLQGKIEEVKTSGGSINTYNLMILVALNLVDDCLKNEDRLNELIQNVEQKSKNLINFIDSSI